MLLNTSTMMSRHSSCRNCGTTIPSRIWRSRTPTQLFDRASRDCDCGQLSDPGRPPSELQLPLLAQSPVVPEGARPVSHPQAEARDLGFLLPLHRIGRNCGLAPFGMQSHSGPVAAPQDEIPAAHLRAKSIRLLHVPTVVIRACPRPALATVPDRPLGS